MEKIVVESISNNDLAKRDRHAWSRMAKPQEFLSDLPILSVVPIDTFGNGRVSQPYFRDRDWRYKDVMGEHLLCPTSAGATTYTTAELSVLFGADLYLSHPLSVSSNPQIFLLPMLHCIQGERGYINCNRITALDVVCQFLPNDIRVTIPKNGIKIPRRNGNRRFFTLSPNRWRIYVEVLIYG